MATLPTVPSFTDGTAPTLAELGQLSYAVSFLTNDDVRPLWHLYQTSPLSLSASTWNQPADASHPYTVAKDSDGVSNGKEAVIVTQGYYAVEACFDVSVNSTAFTMLGSFLWTAGGNNPHFTSGTTLRFGGRGGDAVNDSSSNTAFCITDICPNVCYPGDTIMPQVYVTISGLTLKVNSNDSWNQGRFVPNFTGLWVATGT